MFKVKSVIIFDGELPLNPYFGVQFQLQVDMYIYIYVYKVVPPSYKLVCKPH